MASKKQENFVRWAAQSPRRVVPLMGYPGIRLTGGTVKAHLFNWRLQADALTALAERYNPDAVFVFMDLSLEVDALGAPIRYPLHDRPTVEEPIVRTVSDLEQVSQRHFLDHCRVQVVLRTLRELKRSLPLPVGGYVTGPFTLAGLMMGAVQAAESTLTQPAFLHRVLEYSTGLICRYLRAQAEEGADFVAVLEPSAAFLSPRAFAEFSAAYVSQVVQESPVPCILHICGDARPLLPTMASTGVQGLSLDWPVDLRSAAAQAGPGIVIMGNIDPGSVMARGRAQEVEEAVQTLLDQMADVPNFILSTGCDLPPETPFENLETFVRVARTHAALGQPVRQAV
ncbi:MAG: uroporphyrinogen decarboxylase family protein [candidate division KSB1 bacterium]|nr:uroporphyrinogen decarboxylase family protein [candidate division KSB1 bacterium]